MIVSPARAIMAPRLNNIRRLTWNGLWIFIFMNLPLSNIHLSCTVYNSANGLELALPACTPRSGFNDKTVWLNQQLSSFRIEI